MSKKLRVWAIKSKVTNKMYSTVESGGRVIGPFFHSRRWARELLASIIFKEHWKIVKLEEVGR